MRLVRLKEIRQGTGKTQDRVADDISMPINTYRSWEQLKSSPRSTELNMLADYFSCKVDDLFGRNIPKGAIPARGVEGATMLAYGHIAAGEPIEMCEVIEEAEVPVTICERHPYAYFPAGRIKGGLCKGRVRNDG
jgi:DNA-binding XRE family transcriptional regulator